MSKWKQLREAMKNPPEERLCLINANGYKVGILAIIVVSLFIFQSAIWYIGLIFVVQLVNNWVGYKREMKQYNAIIEAKKMMGVYQEIEDDPSFTRSRFRTIAEEFGNPIKYITVSAILIPSVFIFDLATQPILNKIFIMLGICVVFIFTMLFPIYWAAKFKRGWKNG